MNKLKVIELFAGYGWTLSPVKEILNNLLK